MVSVLLDYRYRTYAIIFIEMTIRISDKLDVNTSIIRYALYYKFIVKNILYTWVIAIKSLEKTITICQYNIIINFVISLIYRVDVVDSVIAVDVVCRKRREKNEIHCR